MYCEPVTTMQEQFEMQEAFEYMMAQANNERTDQGYLEYLIEVISGYYGVNQILLQLNTNKREIVEPRQVIHYYARLLTKVTTKEIGLKVGGRDHATVLHSVKVVDNLMETNKAFQRNIRNINLLLGIN